ncbi:MAG: hypothetical protein LPK58_00470 [Gammaproteobacteria bacterium]|nr:hypothetical protein [Gammaproteobacteria bacterium]MDX5374245.1 hypothetical protein [Gammaproteobacteria bacterium]
MIQRISMRKEGFENFLKNKENIRLAFEKSIYAVLVDMGEDVKGVTWFSSAADLYVKSPDKAAA